MSEVLKLLALAPTCGRRCERTSLILLGLALVSLGLWDIRRVGFDFAQMDVLLLSGVAVFIAGLLVARTIPRRLKATLGRLIQREAVVAAEGASPEADLDKLWNALEDRAGIWARAVAVISAITILIAFLVVFWGEFSAAKIFLTLGEVVGAYVAGTFLGRMACYGQLGRVLTERGLRINVVPGHVDGAAGLKPVGDFFFFQAMVVAVPAVYLTLWWFLIPYWPRYEGWRQPYLGLLQDNPDAYEAASNLPLVENLEGKLLIIQETWNVVGPFSGMMKMLAAFDQAGKPYDLVVNPKRPSHYRQWYMNMFRRYLVEHLKPER